MFFVIGFVCGDITAINDLDITPIQQLPAEVPIEVVTGISDIRIEIIQLRLERKIEECIRLCSWRRSQLLAHSA
jgi:hypothetical protein